jgi:methionyl-tRNA formyltransferase
VYERLMNKGSQLVLKTVRAIEDGHYPSIPQQEQKETKHAPKIFKETCEIKWNASSENIRNFIRGLSPYPAAWTSIQGKIFKVYKSSVVSSPEGQKLVGEFITDNKTYLYFKTLDGWVSIEELQPEGKKKMSIAEFFRGNKL